MNETWRSHDANAGMRFPEESDLCGGQTDDRTPMNTDARQQLVEFNQTLWTLVRRDGSRCDPGFMALAMETADVLSASAEASGREPPDPFADIYGKRMSELNDEQQDRAIEFWCREQIGWEDKRIQRHLGALFRVIDRLREEKYTP